VSENLTLQLSKIIKAPRNRTFAAWTQPAELMQWFAPGPMKAESIDVDLRIGGVFRWAICVPSPQSGQAMNVVFSGKYLEIQDDKLLRFSWQSEANPADETLVTVSFADVEGGTEVAITQERLISSEIYNRNKGGWISMLDKLEVFAASAATEPSVAHAG
jgi:uncharacterized protein YndB with AHSA1/START domain